MKMSKKKVSVNWYQVIYATKDSKLIAAFWKFYNTHKIKSKNRAARCVLISYYSTTSAPDFVLKLFTLRKDIKTVSYNCYELL